MIKDQTPHKATHGSASAVYEAVKRTPDNTTTTTTTTSKNEYVNHMLEDSLVNCNAYLPRDSAFSHDHEECHVYQNTPGIREQS